MNALPPVPAPSRSPWQKFYGAVLARRAQRLAARAERLPAPVVAIGNLHFGGGGKTPFTLAVAARYLSAGRRVAILSRGYGRLSHGPLLVSRGAGPEETAERSGDEPYWLARELPGAVVAVAERRIEAGRLALDACEGAVDLFVLDDGFQHVALARDVDLLLFPRRDPWARGRLLPSGRLREPLSAARRADAAVLTGGTANEAEELAAGLAAWGFTGPTFASATVVSQARRVDGAEVAAGARVFAFAAIADPGGFFRAARERGYVLGGSEGFRDHAEYSELDVRHLEQAARKAGAELLLTTTKDLAKLVGRTTLPLAVLPVAADPEPELWEWLDRRLAELST